MVGMYGTAKQAFEYWGDIDGYVSPRPSPTKKIGKKTYYLYAETPYKSSAERRGRDIRDMGYSARIDCGGKPLLNGAYEKDWKKYYRVWAGNR